MSPAVERRDHSRRHSPDRPESLVRSHHSPRKSSPRSDRFHPPGNDSPIEKFSHSNNKSSRGRSPVREKFSNRMKSPKQSRQRSSSPLFSGTKRTRAQTDRESQRFTERDHVRNSIKEEYDMGKHRERGEVRDLPNERRSMRDINDDESFRYPRHDGAVSSERYHNRRYNSRSPSRASKVAARDEVTMSRAAEQYGDGDFDSVAKMKATENALEAKEKEKPSFEPSGKLAEETNKVRGITILFTEPSDACKPDVRWRLYVFKAGEVLNEPLYVHRQSVYLFGRERRVADIPTDHPSCSKQHAVLQYRRVEKEQSDGLIATQVRPYLMDLGSTNGTFINENRIEPQRYYELLEKDTIKFGNSSREYVMLHENSAG